MDEMKQRIANAVAGRLSAAPDSAAKAELIEELSDNLYRRYQDLIVSGVEQEAAFHRAMDDLGDVDELLEYLSGISPDGPRPESDRGAGRHDWDGWPGKDEFNELIDNVGGILRGALGQANDALRQAKEAMEQAERDSWRPVEEDVEIHVGTDGEKKPGGWEFSAELDSEAGKFFAGAGPKREPDVVYGFGYDRDKGGFFTQWGEQKTGAAEEKGDGPVFSGVNAWFERDDDFCVVRTDKPVRGVDIQSDNGDVRVRIADRDGDEIRIGGDVDKLEVKVTEDGVLAIRQGRTASSSLFFIRGISSADVELYLPRRRFAFLQVSATNGDVEIEDRVELDRLSVRTTSGDLRCEMASCGKLYFKSASGDLECSGLTGQARAETMSGDIRVEGSLSEAIFSTASGDIELDGAVRAGQFSTMSGDLDVRSERLPDHLEMASKSGDCRLTIPEGPFSVKLKTVSGEVGSDFFDFAGSARSLSFDCQGGGPVYALSSVSGDLELRRY